jgi:hypothetical protein
LYRVLVTDGQELANVPVFGVGTAPQLEFFPTGYGAAISTGAVTTVASMPRIISCFATTVPISVAVGAPTR